jgi:hypothetical protein
MYVDGIPLLHCLRGLVSKEFCLCHCTLISDDSSPCMSVTSFCTALLSISLLYPHGGSGHDAAGRCSIVVSSSNSHSSCGLIEKPEGTGSMDSVPN